MYIIAECVDQNRIHATQLNYTDAVLMEYACNQVYRRQRAFSGLNTLLSSSQVGSLQVLEASCRHPATRAAVYQLGGLQVGQAEIIKQT